MDTTIIIKHRRNPLSSQVISNKERILNLADLSLSRNPLSSQVISNQREILNWHEMTLVVIPYQVRSYQTG